MRARNAAVVVLAAVIAVAGVVPAYAQTQGMDRRDDRRDDRHEGRAAKQECKGPCEPRYMGMSAEDMHKLTGLPLAGWSETRY